MRRVHWCVLLISAPQNCRRAKKYDIGACFMLLIAEITQNVGEQAKIFVFSPTFHHPKILDSATKNVDGHLKNPLEHTHLVLGVDLGAAVEQQPGGRGVVMAGCLVEGSPGQWLGARLERWSHWESRTHGGGRGGYAEGKERDADRAAHTTPVLALTFAPSSSSRAQAPVARWTRLRGHRSVTLPGGIMQAQCRVRLHLHWLDRSWRFSPSRQAGRAQRTTN